MKTHLFSFISILTFAALGTANSQAAAIAINFTSQASHNIDNSTGQTTLICGVQAQEWDNWNINTNSSGTTTLTTKDGVAGQIWRKDYFQYGMGSYPHPYKALAGGASTDQDSAYTVLFQLSDMAAWMQKNNYVSYNITLYYACNSTASGSMDLTFNSGLYSGSYAGSGAVADDAGLTLLQTDGNTTKESTADRWYGYGTTYTLTADDLFLAVPNIGQTSGLAGIVITGNIPEPVTGTLVLASLTAGCFMRRRN